MDLFLSGKSPSGVGEFPGHFLPLFPSFLSPFSLPRRSHPSLSFSLSFLPWAAASLPSHIFPPAGPARSPSLPSGPRSRPGLLRPPAWAAPRSPACSRPPGQAASQPGNLGRPAPFGPSRPSRPAPLSPSPCFSSSRTRPTAACSRAPFSPVSDPVQSPYRLRAAPSVSARKRCTDRRSEQPPPPVITRPLGYKRTRRPPVPSLRSLSLSRTLAAAPRRRSGCARPRRRLRVPFSPSPSLAVVRTAGFPSSRPRRPSTPPPRRSSPSAAPRSPPIAAVDAVNLPELADVAPETLAASPSYTDLRPCRLPLGTVVYPEPLPPKV